MITDLSLYVVDGLCSLTVDAVVTLKSRRDCIIVVPQQLPTSEHVYNSFIHSFIH